MCYFILQLVKLSWKPIPLKYAHGIIRNYTVFCQNIFDKSNGTKIYHYGADKTSTIIALNSNMTYKVWIVATNGCGASPMSEVYVLGKKLKENLGVFFLFFSGLVKSPYKY